ncbi:MAG: MFS transporter [Magnetospirillum sp.]|nr:MFS transporter [Magnetospirillum sp.]
MTVSKHNPTTVLICAAAILAVSLGVRHSFGLFLQPVSMAGGWGREVFAFAIALQNLVWGISQPFAGLIADRIGAGKAVIAGTILYALGLLVMAHPAGQTVFILGAGVLVGLGLAGTTYPLVLGAVTRATAPEKRSLSLGIAMGGAAFGQFVMLPGALKGIDWLDWSGALVALSVLTVTMVPLAFPLFERGHASTYAAHGMTAGQGDPHGPAPPGLRAAGARFLRLRLPGGVHRHPRAGIPGGQGSVGRRRFNGAGLHRPAQHPRHLFRRPVGRALPQAHAADLALFGPGGHHRRFRLPAGQRMEAPMPSVPPWACSGCPPCR